LSGKLWQSCFDASLKIKLGVDDYFTSTEKDFAQYVSDTGEEEHQ